MTQFPVEAYQSEVSQIVVDVFSTMLRLEIRQADEEWKAQPGRITAAIFFAGDWKGAVLVECSETQARHWTSRLMSIELPSAYSEDVQDSMGELVNMIGGNLKSVLPRGVGLSMPSVVQGSNYSIRICGGNLVNRQSFVGSNGPFWVTLVEVLERP